MYPSTPRRNVVDLPPLEREMHSQAVQVRCYATQARMIAMKRALVANALAARAERERQIIRSTSSSPDSSICSSRSSSSSSSSTRPRTSSVVQRRLRFGDSESDDEEVDDKPIQRLRDGVERIKMANYFDQPPFIISRGGPHRVAESRQRSQPYVIPVRSKDSRPLPSIARRTPPSLNLPSLSPSHCPRPRTSSSPKSRRFSLPNLLTTHKPSLQHPRSLPSVADLLFSNEEQRRAAHTLRSLALVAAARVTREQDVVEERDDEGEYAEEASLCGRRGKKVLPLRLL